jgi:hypothetical protein
MRPTAIRCSRGASARRCDEDETVRPPGRQRRAGEAPGLLINGRSG